MKVRRFIASQLAAETCGTDLIKSGFLSDSQIRGYFKLKHWFNKNNRLLKNRFIKPVRTQTGDQRVSYRKTKYPFTIMEMSYSIRITKRIKFIRFYFVQERSFIGLKIKFWNDFIWADLLKEFSLSKPAWVKHWRLPGGHLLWKHKW